MYSDFVTNSYGESWDSSCEKSWVPAVITSESHFKKTRSPIKIENAWAFMQADN